MWTWRVDGDPAVTKSERDRRRRAKTQRQKANRYKNVVKDAERRLLGNGEPLPEGWSMTTYAMRLR